MKNLYNLVALYLVVILLAGCSQMNGAGINGDLKISADLQERISTLKAVTGGEGGTKSKASAHLELARIYYQSSSPARSYGKALEELEKYVAIEPEKNAPLEIRNLLALLRELEKEKKVVMRLQKEKAEMTEVINKLNLLDVQLEKKREMMKQREP